MNKQACIQCHDPIKLPDEMRAKAMCGFHLLCSKCIRTHYNTIGWNAYNYCQRCFDFMYIHMHINQNLECAVCKLKNMSNRKLKRLCQDHFLCNSCIRYGNCRVNLQCNYCNHAISRLCAECILPYHLPIAPNIAHPIHSYCYSCINNEDYLCRYCKPNSNDKVKNRNKEECYYCRDLNTESLIPMCEDHRLCNNCIKFFSKLSLKDLHIINCKFCEDVLRLNCEKKTNDIYNKSSEEKKNVAINSESALTNPRKKTYEFAGKNSNKQQISDERELQQQSYYREVQVDSYKSPDYTKNTGTNANRFVLPSEPLAVNKGSNSSQSISSKSNSTAYFPKPKSCNPNPNLNLENRHLSKNNSSLTNDKIQCFTFGNNPNILNNPNEVSRYHENSLHNFNQYYEDLPQNNQNTFNFIKEQNYSPSIPQSYSNILDSSYGYNLYGSEHSHIQYSGTQSTEFIDRSSQYVDDSALVSKSFEASNNSKCNKHNADCLFFKDCHHYQCYYCIFEAFERKFNKFLNSLNSRDLDWLNKPHKNLGCKVKNCFNKFCIPFDIVKHIAESICSTYDYPEVIAHHYQLFFEGIKTTFFICPHCTFTSGYYFQKKCLYCNK
ncbi:hypothetical protein SteCoe_37064 [Stentor coeruleus]|uniref:Uncharacterized protein n=1 Tax=Stentor coeruleus TaxID=5963 RepID=A0A1R2ANV0_9CILI|nr:hypothetical protein SteCoe_37064 [Stentor coeruleus]